MEACTTTEQNVLNFPRQIAKSLKKYSTKKEKKTNKKNQKKRIQRPVVELRKKKKTSLNWNVMNCDV